MTVYALVGVVIGAAEVVVLSATPMSDLVIVSFQKTLPDAQVAEF